MCGAAAVGPMAARADWSARPLRAEIGGFFPTNLNVAPNTVRSAIYLGGTLEPFRFRVGGGDEVLFGGYLDGYSGKDSVTTDATRQLTATTVGMGLIGRYMLHATGSRAYVAAGIGGYYMNFHQSTASAVNGFSTFTTTHLRPGGKLLVGIEAPNGIFAEAGYTIISNTDGALPGGFLVAVGFRF